MEILTRVLPLLILFALPAFGEELPYRVIAYHDIRDNVVGDYDPDQYALSTANLIDQFTWLRDNDYQPVSIDQVIAATEGRQPLPPNAVLLTFDDGLASVYSHVYPLLKLFDYPAVVSIVTGWTDSDVNVKYGERSIGRDDFLTAEQIREMHSSGLVEIASHTHDLHKGIVGNPQGSLQPAAITRAFDGSSYESDAEFLSRIDADLARSVAMLTEIVGQEPRVITWPYGAHSEVVESLAAEHGLHISLTLGQNSSINEKTTRLGRYLATANPGIGEFSAEFLLDKPHPIVRVAQIDLDYIFDTNIAQQSLNLDVMLDRIKALEISHVFLQAFADGDADGGADAVYFPNRHLPVQSDLFDHVAWQLKTRANVSVYAWLPLLSYVGDSFDSEWRVVENNGDSVVLDPDSEPRLSPFHAVARDRIAEIYEDLATYSYFDGILFHDDGRLSDFEDYSEAALSHYRTELGTEITPEIVANDAELRKRWTDLKSDALMDFSAELLARVRRFHPSAKSARNIFSSALLDDAGTEYLAQDFDSYLQSYDFVALMAMPELEGAADTESFYQELVAAVGQRDAGLERTIFELQTVDWRQSRPIPSDKLRSTMRWLQSLGVRNLGYYPDDFVTGHPDFDQLRLGMSLAEDLAGALR